MDLDALFSAHVLFNPVYLFIYFLLKTKEIIFDGRIVDH